MEQTEEEIVKARQILQEQLIRGAFGEKVDQDVEIKMNALFQTHKDNIQKKFIRRVDNQYPYQIIKEGIKSMWNKEQTLTFFINRNIIVKGKITNMIDEGIVELPLLIKAKKTIRTQREVMEVRNLFCFGDKIEKDWTHEEVLCGKFFIYRMICKNDEIQENYLIVSDLKLNLEEYTIEGMLLDLEDFSEVSKYARLMKRNHIIFVHSAKPSKIIFKSNDELFEVLNNNNLTQENFFKYLFSLKFHGQRIYFKHPLYFEKLIGAFLLSTKNDSSPYPLHLLVIGKQGGGKSKAQEAIFEKLNETIPIIEGAGSTMKSLIPSFRSETTKAGALIESNRVCFVDEFFRILMRVDKDDRENQLTHLNPLLEHKMRRFGSGNNFLDGQMSSKLLAVTNPIFGTSNMQMLSNKIDNSFLSRLMIWFQDEEHYDKVTKTGEHDLELIEDNFDNNLLLSIYDHCNSFKIIYDHRELDKVYTAGSILLKEQYENVRGIYASRYKHHLICLLDGLVKLRCIFERDGSFTAKPQDFETLKEIWERMIMGWLNGIKNDRYNYGHNKEERYYG